MQSSNADKRTREISARLLTTLETRLAEARVDVRRRQQRNNSGWRFDCRCDARAYRVLFDPTDNSIAVHERRWLLKPYLWGFALESSDDIDDAANVALEVIQSQPVETHRPVAGWAPTANPITDANYHQLFAAQRTLIIHFWAPWNGVDPPAHKELAKAQRRLDGIAVYACNIDENATLASELQIASIPSFVVVVEGKPTAPIIGLHSSTRLELDIRQRISSRRIEDERAVLDNK